MNMATPYQFFACPVKHTIILVTFSVKEVLEQLLQVGIVRLFKEIQPSNIAQV